ncbi:uncharacterized membrane protein YebE (DUF533 family) [Hoeflea marina]|uniref:Uncharacterized membrane protein YebE (DUF533 family) n=1 Tax=Hoeflea marina TaxID=274592 RepID=A0A317PEJ6_9HYPH|nr:tellurite resistance TerB family protein [Hoeflea marina]PWV97154.1 uncharacterized membrane protein YebE (DUF533 family) [Hoeflea marina]
MFDPKALLDQFFGAQVPGTQGTVGEKAGQGLQMAKDNPLATGAIAAVLLGTGAGRSLTGSALKLGGLAVVAGLGYQAWKSYQAGGSPQPAGPVAEAPIALPPKDSDFAASTAGVNATFTTALLRVMLAAARADGHVDDAERSRIISRLSLAGLGPDAMSFIEDELTLPVDLDGIVAQAGNEAEKVELYTAARLAIDPDTPAEHVFLNHLSGRLGLSEGLIEHIEATVSSAKV